MKRLSLRIGLLITIPLLLTTCSKIDWDFFQKHQDKKNCKVSAYYLTLNPEVTFPFLFEKKFNHTGDRVTEIECSYNTVTLVEGLIHQQLRVVYAGKRIFFINKNNPNDTVPKAFYWIMILFTMVPTALSAYLIRLRWFGNVNELKNEAVPLNGQPRCL